LCELLPEDLAHNFMKNGNVRPLAALYRFLWLRMPGIGLRRDPDYQLAIFYRAVVRSRLFGSVHGGT
jgi:hypothetical protein